MEKQVAALVPDCSLAVDVSLWAPARRYITALFPFAIMGLVMAIAFFVASNLWRINLMNTRQLFIPCLFFSGLSLLLLVGISIATVRQPETAKHPPTLQGFVPALRKAAKTKLADSGSNGLVISLNGIQADDYINIRPSIDEQITVSAGTLLTVSQGQGKENFSLSGCPSCLTSSIFNTGDALPEASLEVTSDTVTFNRPVNAKDVVFLDIQIPEQARAKVSLDGEIVLKAAILQPLSLHHQRWEPGSKNAVTALLKAALSGKARNNSVSDRPVFDSRTGYYAVPASSLKLLEKYIPQEVSGYYIIMVLQINESGQVVNAIPMTDNFPARLKEAVSKWRFDPFLIDGHSVPVSTIMEIR